MATQTVDVGQASWVSARSALPPAAGSVSLVRVWFWLAGGAGGVKVGLPVRMKAPAVPPVVPSPLIMHWVVEGQSTWDNEDTDPDGDTSVAGKRSMDQELPDPLTDPVRTTGPTGPPATTVLPEIPMLPVPMAIQVADERTTH